MTMTSHDNVTDIETRLRRKHQAMPAQGSASLGTDGLGNTVSTSYITDDGMRLVNPDGPEAAELIATLRKQLENAREALRHIKIEAEREQGHWQHLKRVIAVHATEALKGQPDNKPSGIPVDSPTSIQHDKSGYTP